MTNTEKSTPTVRGPGKSALLLEVNGTTHEIFVEPRRTLLDALRVDLGMTGTKEVCGMGNCGACTVQVDGEPTYGCLQLAVECEGRAITTIEGLSHNGTLHPLQQAFVEHDALQCGFCTSGQVMTAAALLKRNPDPTEEEIVEELSGNLCRCGAYRGIVRAVQDAAEKMRT